MGKNSERCKAEGIVFIPLVVDTFGGWHKDSLEVITREAGKPADWEGGGRDCKAAAAKNGNSVGER